MEQNLEQQLREAGIMEEELANMEVGEGDSHSPSASPSPTPPIPPPPPAPPKARAAAPAPTTGTAPPAPPVPAMVAQLLLPCAPPQSRSGPGHPSTVRKSIFHALLLLSVFPLFFYRHFKSPT